MQRFLYSLTLALSLTAGAVLGAAQPAPEEDRARLQAMVDELQLTEEQKSAIAPIVQQQIADLKALRENTALRQRHKLKRAREINEASSAKIRGHLTPEQQAKYDAMREEMKEEMREKARERMKDRNAAGGSAAP